MKRLCFAVALLLGLAMAAQAAGPPAGAAVWLDGNAGVATGGGFVTTWTDQANSIVFSPDTPGTSTQVPIGPNMGINLPNNVGGFTAPANPLLDVTAKLDIFWVGDFLETSGAASAFWKGGNYNMIEWAMAPRQRIQVLNGLAEVNWWNRPQQIHIVQVSATAAGYSTFINGALEEAVPGALAFVPDGSVLTMFGQTGAPNNNNYGTLAEALLYGDSAVDTNAVGWYLQQKYGIQGTYTEPVVVAEPAGLGLLGVALLGLRKRRS